MKLIISILSITLAGTLFINTASFCGGSKGYLEDAPWGGMLEDGTVISKDRLSKILEEHEKWLETKEGGGEGQEGKQANLRGADLSEADLSRANLIEANLRKANLIEANLTSANLDGANLSEANLSRADLRWANLREANLREAYLRGADLFEADLRGADLSETDLRGAYLYKADLRGADLSWANLSEAELVDTNLKDAIFLGLYLTEARYEPSSSPHKGSLGGLKGLTTIRFSEGKQSGLVQLRAALKDAGLRNLEREATYVIEHWKTYYAPWYVKWVKLLLFEWTSGYGLNYLRPLLILSGLFLGFSIVYIFPIAGKGKKGIYRVWSKKKENGIEELEKLIGVKFIGYAFYFSVLSTFHIGWRDLNVGSWIARMQPNEYFMKATGWVRTVSGIQSLISIYLLALWVLTQFGRPFE